MKTVITGSIAYDYLMSFPGRFTDHLLVDQLHKISLSFLVDSMKRQRGGIAANIAYTLALLGGRPRIMATVGEDFGDYRSWLEQNGVDTSAVIEIPGDYCASFFVNTDQAQNQIASFYTGAMAHSARLSFSELAADTDLAIISPNDPTAMRAYAAECKRLGIRYIYDPSQQTIRLSGADLCDGLDGCFLLAANEYEFALIREKTGLSERQLLERAGGLLITKGSDGAELRVGGQVYDIPAVPPFRVIEPTGAGDAFRAGLLRGIQLGLPWEVVGRLGALAATYVLEELGTQNHRFTPAEFVARYRQHFDDQGALDILR
ncbi:MAG: carbohydrate kinase family protein [Chloroflexota bacterium]